MEWENLSFNEKLILTYLFLYKRFGIEWAGYCFKKISKGFNVETRKKLEKLIDMPDINTSTLSSIECPPITYDFSVNEQKELLIIAEEVFWS